MAAAKMRISYPHVTKTPGVCGGKARIDGTRVRVNNVVFLHKNGANDKTIREAYRDLPEAVIIHETLHSLGLGENPPTSDEITWRVFSRCG